MLNSAGKVVQAAEIAAKAILVDILTGNFQITSSSTYNASQVQISAFALQKVAASFGVAIFGYSTGIEGLKQALEKGPAIVWMDLGNGMGHYVTVTSIQNGQVTYKDSDGKTYTISVEEFKSKAKGGLKVLSQEEGIKGEKLTEEQLKETKGASKKKKGRGGRGIGRIFGGIVGGIFGGLMFGPAGLIAGLALGFNTSLKTFGGIVGGILGGLMFGPAGLIAGLALGFNTSLKTVLATALIISNPLLGIALARVIDPNGVGKLVANFFNSTIGKVFQTVVVMALMCIPGIGWLAAAALAAVWMAVTTYAATGSLRAAITAGIITFVTAGITGGVSSWLSGTSSAASTATAAASSTSSAASTATAVSLTASAAASTATAAASLTFSQVVTNMAIQAAISMAINATTQLILTGRVDWNQVWKAGAMGAISAGAFMAASATVSLLGIQSQFLSAVVSGAIRGTINAIGSTALYGGKFAQNLAIGITSGAIGGAISYSASQLQINYVLQRTIEGTLTSFSNYVVTQWIKGEKVDWKYAFDLGASTAVSTAITAGVQSALKVNMTYDPSKGDWVPSSYNPFSTPATFDEFIGSFIVNSMTQFFANLASSYVMFQLYTKDYIEKNYGVDIDFSDYLNLEDDKGRTNLENLFLNSVASGFEIAFKPYAETAIVNTILKYTDYTDVTGLTIRKGGKVIMNGNGSVVNIQHGEFSYISDPNNPRFGITTTGKAEITGKVTEDGRIELTGFTNLTNSVNQLTYGGKAFSVSGNGTLDFTKTGSDMVGKGTTVIIVDYYYDPTTQKVDFNSPVSETTIAKDENGNLTEYNLYVSEGKQVIFNTQDGATLKYFGGSYNLLEKNLDKMIITGTVEITKNGVTTKLKRDGENQPLEVKLSGPKGSIDPVFGFKIMSDNKASFNYSDGIIKDVKGEFHAPKGNGGFGELVVVYKENEQPYYALFNNGKEITSVALASNFSDKYFVYVDEQNEAYLIDLTKLNDRGEYTTQQLNVSGSKTENNSTVYIIQDNSTIDTGDTKLVINSIVKDSNGRIFVNTKITEIKVENNWNNWLKNVNDLGDYKHLLKNNVVYVDGSFYVYKDGKWQKVGDVKDLNGWKVEGDKLVKEGNTEEVIGGNITTKDGKLNIDGEGKFAITSDGKLICMGDIKGTYTNPDGQKVDVTLKANSKIVAPTNEKGEMIYIVKKGLLGVGDKAIEIEILSGGGGGLPKSDTNAVVKEEEIKKDGTVKVKYTISNGVVDIQDGQFIVRGDGAVFKEGSILSDVGKVEGGDLKMTYSTDSKPIYYSADNRVVTTTKDLGEGKTLEITYNKAGVQTGKIIINNAKDKTIELLDGNKGIASQGRIIYYLDIRKAKGQNNNEYNVLAVDEKGHYKISSVKYENVRATRKVGTKELSAKFEYYINGTYDVKTKEFNGQHEINVSIIDRNISNKPMNADLIKTSNNTTLAITKDHQYAYEITDKGITRANGSYEVLTASVKQGKDVLNIYGSLSCQNGKVSNYNPYSSMRGKINGVAIEANLKYNPSKGYFDILDKNGKPIPTPFSGKYRNEEVKYKAIGLKVDDKKGELYLVADIQLEKGKKIDDIKVNPEKFSGGGKERKEQPSFGPNSPTLEVTGSKDKWNIKNIGNVKAGFIAEISLEEAVSGKIKTITFSAFKEGTIVKAGEGGFSVSVKDVIEKPVYIGGQQVNTVRVDMERTIIVHKGTEIRIYNEGGINANLQYSKGEITIRDDVRITDIHHGELFNGTREVKMKDGKVSVEKIYGKNIGKVNPEMRIDIGDGRYIDMKSLDYDIQTTRVAQLWDEVVGTSAMIIGGLGSLITLGKVDFFVDLSNFGTSMLAGHKPVSELTFGDRLSAGFDAIMNVLTITGVGGLVRGLVGVIAKGILKTAIKEAAKMFSKEMLKRAAIGAAFGGSVTAAGLVINGADFTNLDTWKTIGLGAILGGLASVGGLRNFATFTGSATISEKVILNMALTGAKNLVIGEFVLKPYINGLIDNSNITPENKQMLKAITDNAVDIWVFMSLPTKRVEQVERMSLSWSGLKTTFRDGIKYTMMNWKGVVGGSVGFVAGVAYEGSQVLFGWGDKKFDWEVVGGLSIVGYTIGNLLNIGKRAFVDPETGLGVMAQLKNNLRVDYLIPRTVGMVQDIVYFQGGFTGILAGINYFTGGKVVTALKSVPGLYALDKLGLNLIDSIDSLSYSSSFISALYKLSEQTTQTIYSKDIWMFSLGVAFAMPLLSPIVTSVPGLGTIMRPISYIGNNVSFGNQLLNRIWKFGYEEGFQEVIPGWIGGKFLPHGANEVFQELFDRTPNVTNINAKLSQRLSKVDSGYVSNVDSIKKLDITKATPLAVQSINRVLEQKLGSGGINVGEISAKLVGSAKTTQELRDIMVSVAAVSDAGLIKESVQIGDVISQNSKFLQSNPQISKLTTEQQIRFLTNVNRLGAINERGELNIGAIKNSNDVDTLSDFVINTIPVLEGRDYSENFHSAFSEGLSRLNELVQQTPSINNISKLTDVCSFLLNSRIKTNPADISKPFTTLAVSLSNLEIQPAVSREESSPQEIDVYQQTIDQLIPSLDLLGSVILAKGNSQLLNLFTSAVSSNLSLRNMINLWTIQQLSLKQTETPPVLQSIVDSVGKYNIERILRNIEDTSTDIQTKLILLNFASTVLAERRLVGSEVSSEVGRINDAIRNLDLQQIEGNSQLTNLLLSTIAKLNVVNGITGVEESIYGEGINNFVKANEGKFNEIKEVAQRSYGRVVEVRREIKDIVDFAEEVVKQEDSSQVRSLFEAKLREIYSEQLKDGSPQKDKTEKLISSILARYDNLVEKISDKLPAAVLISFVEQRVREWKEDPNFKFNDAQVDAFVNIVDAMFEEKQQHRYTHVLQTGGGKTYLAVASAMLLRAQTPQTEFVAVFSNTIDNAKDVYKHITGIFGDLLGSVVIISSDDLEKSRQNPQELREKLASASIVVTTYDIWSGLIADTFSKLLSEDKPYGKQNIELLNKNSIKVTRDAKGRVTFEDATQARQALNLLLSQGYNREITDISLPLDRIGSAVADEIDFFSTIPMQALAVSMGKYYKADKFVEYYEELSKLSIKTKVTQSDIANLVEKYRDIGIDLARVNRDLQSASQNAEYLQQVRQMYENIGELVKNGKSKDDIMKEISVPEGISKEQVSSEVEQLVNNRRAIKYFHELERITKDLYEKSNVYEGTIKIGDKVIKISKIWQFGSKSLVQEILGLEVKEDTKELQQKVSKKAEEVDVRELISKHAEELEQEFKGLFSKAEIIEHLWNGIGAHGLKEGNEYYVKDGRVWVTNLGRGVENLMLPSGMMQVLEVKHNVDISKPNAETYISNSVFAMSLFSDIVGLTGTVSKGVDSSVLSRMGFEKNGTAPKVESHWRLFQTQKGMVRFIIEATRHMNNQGVANFNLILTPNSAISRMAYETLIESGISEEEIKYVGPDVSDAELEELRKEVMQGKYKFVIADAYLLGRGWNVGKMLDAANVFKEKQNATAEKVQATLWLLEPHLMTETQMLQAAGRIDPFGNNRFDTSAYTKDIISLASIESAIEVERLRKAANEKGSWTIDIITDNLQKVQLENEQEALRRAGQKVVVLAEESFIQQQKQSPPTVKEAKEILNQNGVAEKTQQEILQQIGIQPTQQSTEKLTPQQHFRLNTILKIYNLLKAVLPDDKGIGVISALTDKELDEIVNVKQQEYVSKVIELVVNKVQNLPSVDKNILNQLNTLLNILNQMVIANENLQTSLSKLTVEQYEGYINIIKELQNKENPSLIDQMKVAFSLRRKYPEVYKAQKELTKLSKKFEKQKENIADKLISQQKSEVASLVLGITLDEQKNLRFDEEKIKEVKNVVVNLHQLGLSVESVKAKDIKDVVEGKRTSISLIENLAKRQNNEQLQEAVKKLEAGIKLNEVEVIANELGMPKEQIISMIDLTTNPQQTLSEKRAAGIQSDILSVYNVLKQRLQQKVITLEEEKQLIDVILTLQQQPKITVATYKESYEILQQLFRNTSNINELYKALYNSLRSNSENKTLKVAVESLPKFTGQVSVINTITGSDQEIKEELKEVLSLTKNQELLMQVYTPKLDVKDKGVIIKLDESGELLAKIYDSKGNEEVYKTDEAVAKLRELGVFNEGNIMVVSRGDAISAAKFGMMLPLSSIIMNTHPQEASLKVSLADRKVLDVVSNTVMVNFVNNLVGYLLDKATRLEAEIKHKEFEEKVGQNENEIVTDVQNMQQKVNIGEVKPISVKGVGECVMIDKPEYQIIYYFVDDKQKVDEEKNKYAQIKQVLADKVVRFAVLDKQIDDKQAVIIVREKVENLNAVKPEIGLKQVAEINKVLWMCKMRDVELGNNENWKNNYGVNSRVEVVLSNPIVVSNEAIPEDKPIGEIVKINDELRVGGYLKESDLTCWGSPNGPQLDPLGLGRIASILSDVATKGKELRSIPKLIRGAA